MTNYYSDRNTGLHLVKLNGPLLRSRADEVTAAFEALFGQGARQVVVDLAGVPLIDSAGLATLINGYRRFGSQPQNFRLAGLQDQPRLVFDLTGFDNIFLLYDTALEAVAGEPAALEPVFISRPQGRVIPVL